MRFRTRDLLLLTTIVALYTALLPWMHRRAPLDLDLRFRGVWIQNAFIIGPTLYGIRRKRAVGEDAARFRRRWAIFYHGLPALALLAMGALRVEMAIWPFAVLFVISHVGAEVASHVVVGAEGVIPHLDLLRWNEYLFSIEGDKLVCTPTFNPQERKTERHTLWQEDADELRAFLEENQPKYRTVGYYG